MALDNNRISRRNFQARVPESIKCMVGQRFGRLLITKHDGREGAQNWAQHFLRGRCDCGEETSTTVTMLRSGKVQSCGCLRRERALQAATFHGHARDSGNSKEYIAWAHMKERCSREKCSEYRNYGGRGIKVCQRWATSFVEFYKDMGSSSKGLSLDRINNEGHYSCGKCEDCSRNGWPMNCRWATGRVQGSNTRRNKFVLFHGERTTYSEAARAVGISCSCLGHRIRRGKNLPEGVEVFYAENGI